MAFALESERVCMQQKTLSVSGMACGGCEQTVEDALANLDGVSDVEADHETDTVEVASDGVSEGEIQAAIEDAGYDVADA